MTDTKQKKDSPKPSSSKKVPSSSQKTQKKKPRMTVEARKKQLRFRIGLLTGAFCLLFLLWGFGLLPFQKGKAVHLTDSVLQYQNQVETYCREFEIPAFSQVVLAIMQQESAGMVPDVMQASESPFNTWYPNTPGAIQDSDYSIQVGVETFAYCLSEAGCKSPRDKDRLKLALQNYNYGNSYATWALENYGGYSPDNALEFSETMKQRLGWSTYGDPNYVDHVLRYYRAGY